MEVLSYPGGSIETEPAMKISRADLRNALLCGLAVVIAVGLSLPISESPFNDDWSYSFTVKRLLETGKLTYNGWASASLIAQAYWGWLWVKAFGFSYTVLRLSTLPLASAAISLCYLLARRVGLMPRFAVFAALMVGLCPLYTPVASSFMTDAPGLFFIFLSMYLLARSIDSRRSFAALAWLAAGMLVGLVGGTGRQIVWVVPLVMAPFAAWLKRDNLAFVFCAVFGSALVLGGALFTLRWFAHQPYSVPEIPVTTQLKSAIHKPAHYLLNVLAIFLTTIWMILPVLWRITRNWTPNRALVAFILLIGPVMLLAIWRPRYSLAPWMGNTLSYQGVMGGAELAGDRPIAMPKAIRAIIGVVVFAVMCAMSADLLLFIARPLTAMRKLRTFFLFPRVDQQLLPAMILFASAYFILLLPRCATNMAYDRYVLPLMPCIIFPLLLSYQRMGDRKVPMVSWVLLGIFACYGIAITQEVTALGRARAAAANRLISAGVPRTAIDAGFEYDFETQIFATGYVNDPRILTPARAFKKNLGPTYAVQAKYRLEFAPAQDTAITSFGYVPYITYLYPFHRRVYIDRFIDPWWLDPTRAATHPADSHHQMMPAPGTQDD